MDLAHLVDAVTRARTLAAFVLAGALLAGAGRLVGAARPELVVRVPVGADAATVASAVDEALLVELGLELGWRDDPLIVDGLVRGLGFVGLGGERAALVEEAAALDLPRRDPLARARAAERARRLLARVPTPSEAELAAFLAASPERFRRPDFVRFEHRREDGGAPDVALGPHVARSADWLAHTLGRDAAAAILAQPVGPDAPWSAPITSRLGTHRVRVLARTPGAVPPLDAIRAEVAGAWAEARRAEALAQGLARLRASKTIVVEAVLP